MGTFGSRGGLVLRAPLKRSECKDTSTTPQTPVIGQQTTETTEMPRAMESPKKTFDGRSAGQVG